MQTRNINWKEILILVIIILFLLIFWNFSFMQPLRMFTIFNHEASHGLATLATGGKIVNIGIEHETGNSEGGFTETIGGNKILMYNAGYLGSILFGSILLFLSKHKKFIKTTLFFTAVYIIIVSILFIKIPQVKIYGITFALGLLLVIATVPSFASYLALRVLALSNCLFALLDVISDYGASGFNDAVALQRLTSMPAAFWWTAWLLISFIIVFIFIMLVVKKEDNNGKGRKTKKVYYRTCN